MSLPNITLISFGFFEQDFLEQIATAVQTEFDCTVNIREGRIDLGEYYDPARRQYNGNTLIKIVDSMVFPEPNKILGLFNVDLFIPILTYIFGQAYLNGRSGIASVYRLSNERYGLPKNEQILLDRTKKEVIHELGHTFGLIHCDNPICVMRSSTYLEDVDQKKQHLCHKCLTKL
ncbi:MAG: archaemetzincin family Zn-dependent metalloprotease [Mariniphaga sp.]